MAIVFGHETLTFLARSHIFILIYTEGVESTGLGIIPKKYHFFVDCFPYASFVFNKVETNLILHISSGSSPFISRLPPTTLAVPAATTVPPSAIPAATISTAASVSAAAELR